MGKKKLSTCRDNAIIFSNNSISSLIYIFLDTSTYTRRKMDIQDKHLHIQLCDKHLIYSVVVSKCSAVISKMFILTYFNTLDSEAEYSDITVQCLDIKTEYIKYFSYS